MKDYFRNLWAGIVTTWVGMRLTLRYLIKPSVTLRYPEERPVIPAGYRGIHGYGEEKCSVCKSCAAACPVDCITIEQLGRGKDAMVMRFEVDYSRCLFCDLCTIPCPTQCIWLSERYDLAGYTREECRIDFARPKSPEEIAAHEKLLRKKEEEKKAKAAAAAAAKAKKETETKAAAEASAPQAGDAPTRNGAA
ncbi:MAG TPA: NADH-quinone oxidoreductase subunit I [Candidatus Sumerlaeota bacterium]|nr:NADH-quinone oxidoreductase subunit I [Candidatus Sumerlaeota bacterium]